MKRILDEGTLPVRARLLGEIDALVPARYFGVVGNELRRARLLIATALVLGLCGPVFSGVALLQGTVLRGVFFLVPGNLLVLAVPVMVRREVSLDTCGAVLCASLFYLLGFHALVLRSSLALSWICVLPLLVLVLGDRRLAVSSLVLTITLIALGEHFQPDHPFGLPSKLQHFIVRTALTVVLCLIGWLETTSRERTVRTLARINAALGEEVAARQFAEDRLQKTHNELIGSARMAGQAEVAATVLHNVGNVLSSVLLATRSAEEGVRTCRVEGISRLVGLLEANYDDLPAFLSEPARAERVLAYLREIDLTYRSERDRVQEDLARVAEGLSHIRAVILRQQALVRHGLEHREVTDISELLGEVAFFQAEKLDTLDIRLTCRNFGVREALLDRHRVLAILCNLVSNACVALRDVTGRRREVELIASSRTDAEVVFDVIDNGTGVAPEHRQRIFELGYTTRHDGSGFGLHFGAISAQEMGGSLTFESAGADRGAHFTLALPLNMGDLEDMDVVVPIPRGQLSPRAAPRTSAA